MNKDLLDAVDFCERIYELGIIVSARGETMVKIIDDLGKNTPDFVYKELALWGNVLNAISQLMEEHDKYKTKHKIA